MTRLIDADVLRTEISNLMGYIGSGMSPTMLVRNEVLDLIDNAPTVPLPDFKEGYKQAIIDGKTNFSRTKGEWIKWNFKTFGALGDWEYKCSNCEKVYDGEYNFCPNCGADMQKGGERK